MRILESCLGSWRDDRPHGFFPEAASFVELQIRDGDPLITPIPRASWTSLEPCLVSQAAPPPPCATIEGSSLSELRQKQIIGLIGVPCLVYTVIHFAIGPDGVPIHPGIKNSIRSLVSWFSL